MVQRDRLARLVLLVVAGSTGCVVGGTDPDDPIEDEDGELAQLEAAASCVTLDNRSLVETAPAIVSDARFSMKRVFEQIRTTTPADAPPPSTATAMFKQIYNAHARCTSNENIDPNDYGLKCRSPEAKLGSLDPFTGTAGQLHFKPVALMNRFDLSPTTFATCGESRIVYWMDGGAGGRASIIVEMRTPPVTLADGTRSCKPVAEFWTSLSSIDDADQRAAKLESFYFDGLPGMPFPPVSARGVGFGGAGQIRTNSFIDNAQWNLREFKWQKQCKIVNNVETCSARFNEVTTKNNPSQKLFAGTHPKSAAFQDWFVQTAVPTLAGAKSIHAFALGNATGFNTYESISQPLPGDPTSVQYRSAASSAFRARISKKLEALGSNLTVNNVLDRATTQTCGGCHQVSSGTAVGGGLSWPSAGGFTHVNESGTLSPALTTKFLPKRKAILGAFMCQASSGKTTSDEMTSTIAGGAPEAPN